MKKLKYFLLCLMLLPCSVLLSACTVKTEYVAPAVTEEVVITSDLTQATNLAMTSTLAIFTETKNGYGAGAGIIYSLDKDTGEAYVITNYHVICGDSYFGNTIASKIYAQPYGSQYCSIAENFMGQSQLVTGNNLLTCEYVGGSQAYDIAVLYIKSDLLSELDVKQAAISTTSAKLGSTVIAIGNPNFQGLSATRGIISVESETIDVYVGQEAIMPTDTDEIISYRAIRFDAAINSGNSGGGLFNEKGQLIGIASAAAEDLDDFSSAIPVSVAVGVTENIINSKNLYGLNGVYLVDLGISYEVSNSYSIFEEQTGLTFIKEDVLVSSVSNDKSTLLYNSGISVGDKITSIKVGDRNLELSRAYELDDFLLTVFPGNVVEITWVNGDGAHSVTLETSKSNFALVEI